MNCPKCGAESFFSSKTSIRYNCCSAEWTTREGKDFNQSTECKLTCAEKHIKELEDENARLRKFLSSYVKSARPNKLDHPKKFAAWVAAKKLLSNHGVRQPKDL